MQKFGRKTRKEEFTRRAQDDSTEIDLMDLGYGSVVQDGLNGGAYSHDNEILGSIKYKEFLECLSDYWLIKTDSTQCNITTH
jgi:hypothetical protein